MSEGPLGWFAWALRVAERLRSPLLIAGVVLLAFYAVSRNVLDRVELTRLTAQGSALFLHTILQQVFVIALVTIVLSVTAYVVPQVLPKSLFVPAPRLEYGVAVLRMMDPNQDPLAKVLQSVETFPGFPYYSRESDHPSAWPPRVHADRERLFQKYSAVFQDPTVRARLDAD